MSLADHWSEDKYLTSGEWEVEVTKYRVFDCNSGNRGVEFALRHESGRETKTAFILTEKALWKLATFARDLGFTKDQCRTYDPFKDSAHQMLVGRRIIVDVDKDSSGKYHEVVDWRPINPDNPATGKRSDAPKFQDPRSQDYAPTSGDEVPF